MFIAVDITESLVGHLLQSHRGGVHVHQQPRAMWLDKEALRDAGNHVDDQWGQADADGASSPIYQVWVNQICNELHKTRNIWKHSGPVRSEENVESWHIRDDWLGLNEKHNFSKEYLWKRVMSWSSWWRRVIHSKIQTWGGGPWLVSRSANCSWGLRTKSANRVLGGTTKAYNWRNGSYSNQRKLDVITKSPP